MTSHRVTSDVQRAVAVLRNGGVIGMPTETVYGLAALALEERAVLRVFEVKGRPKSHPLIVHLGSVEELNEWGELNDIARLLAERFMPGPLTLLVPRTKKVPDWVTGGRDTVALRVPSHPVARDLLAALNTAVVAPSANRFGRVSPTTADHVMNDLGDDVDLVLDGGPCEVGLESTIVECSTNGVAILRPGIVTEEEIRDALSIEISTDSGVSRAPGMLKSHYAPKARVVLVESVAAANVEVEKANKSGMKAVVLHRDNVEEYAEMLYADMRTADQNGVAMIVAVIPSDNGIGKAVRDRLTKAAADQQAG